MWQSMTDQSLDLHWTSVENLHNFRMHGRDYMATVEVLCMRLSEAIALQLSVILNCLIVVSFGHIMIKPYAARPLVMYVSIPVGAG